MAYELIKYKKEFNDEIRYFQCATLADISSLPNQESSPKCATGSMCIVEENAAIFILGIDQTWKELDPVTISIVNDLVTDNAYAPLSAAQGKVLKELIDQKIAKTSIADNLTTDDANKVASAKQLKVLDEKKIDKTSITNLADATDGQVLTSNGDGTSTFEICNSDLIDNVDTAGNFKATTVGGALAESAVKIAGISASIVSGNYLNTETMEDGYYMAASGVKAAGSTFCLTDYIPVSPGEIITFQTELAYTGTRYIYSIRFTCAFNSSKVVVPAAGSNSGITFYVVPSGVYYLKLTFEKTAFGSGEYNLKTAIFKTASVMPYTPYAYSAYKVIEEKISKICDIAFPNQIYTLADVPFTFYYQNVIDGDINDFYISPTGNIAGTDSTKDHVVLTPTTGTVNMRIGIELYNKSSHEIINGRYAVVNNAHTSYSNGNYTVLVIGDSTVSQGYDTQQILNLSAGDGEVTHVTLLGTKGTAPNLHEGYAGWTTGSFMVASNSGTTNPFYNNGFDFAYYMTQNSYASVDAVIIRLGINDFANIATEESFNEQVVTSIANIKTMINSIRAFSSTVKILIDLMLPSTEVYSAFRAVFGSSQTPWRYRRNNIKWNNILINELSPLVGVYLIAINAFIDCKNNISDAVHPSAAGGQQIGSTHFAALKYLLNS